MEVSIGVLDLAGRVAGAHRAGPRTDVAGFLTGEPARQRILDALAPSFGGPEVIVIRSLSCRALVGLDRPAAADVLPRAIAAAVARLLRDHPSDDDVVVRFRDMAAFLAAYLHDSLDGHGDRWYYTAFDRYLRQDKTADWVRLLADHREHRWAVLAHAQGHGDLDRLLATAGPEAAAVLAGGTSGRPERWAPLVATAAALAGVDAAGNGESPAAVAVDLAAAGPEPDWQDPVSLGAAVGAAVRRLLGGAPDDPGPVLRAAGRHDWFDQRAFRVALKSSPVEPMLSPRSRQVLADLRAAVRDPRLDLDPATPRSPANLVRLVAALIRHAPRWSGDEPARSLVGHVLDCWAREASPAAGTARAAARSIDAPGSASPRSVAYEIGLRFANPAPSGRFTPSPIASGLLVFRALRDLGVGASVLGTIGGRPLLSELLCRWSGVDEPDDPLLGLVAGMAAEPIADLDGYARRIAWRMTGQRLVEPPLRRVTVPHGASGFATPVIDSGHRLLPMIAQDDLDEDPEARADVAAALAAFGRDGEVLVDLLAACCVQVWGRWLPGFATASVPFLLEKMVRRPARIAVSESAIDVRLAPRPHDIVLRLAGYLDPIDPPTAFGARRIRFTVGDDDD